MFNKLHSLLICFFLLFATFMFAQKAANIKVSTTNEQMIIEYDLTGNSQSTYMVELQFKQADGTYIKPQTLRGDIGKVTAGPTKTIVWEVYKDVKGIQGTIEPEFTVTEIKKADLKPQATPKPPMPDPNRPTVDVNINKVKYSNKALRFGAKLSTGKSHVKTASQNFTKKHSWQGGLYFRWNIERKIYLQPEVLFHRQSFNQVINTNNEVTHNLHYVRGQALAGFKPIGLGLYFNAGVYYAHLLGGNEQTEIDGISNETFINDLPIQNMESSPYLKNDAGYVLGGTLSINKGAFAIGVLHSRGFNNIVNNNYWLNEPEKQNTLRNSSTHFFIQKSIIKSKRANNGNQNIW